MASDTHRSLSNREDLVRDLQNIALAYQSKPSSLLVEFEHFLQVNGLSPDKKKPWKPTREPAWKVQGFKSKKAMQDFENRTDFPGWDEL
jgi:hypothetical protein